LTAYQHYSLLASFRMGVENLSSEPAPYVIERVPVCVWCFNKAHRFHYISGDTALFRRRPEELVHRHVSMIDDPKGSWAERLDRIFSSKTAYDTVGPTSTQEHVIMHLRIRATSGSVIYAAGFAYNAGDPIPAVRELELAALAILQVLQNERAFTERFLHEVIAPCMSGAGLQLELLRLDSKARQIELPDRADEIQRSLDEAMRQVRAFNSRGEGTA
jgi:hypothetical protein